MDKEQKSFDEILVNFQKWYSPAETIDRCTDFLSTEEIIEAMNQFDPSLQVAPPPFSNL
jgi:hypothetical protein